MYIFFSTEKQNFCQMKLQTGDFNLDLLIATSDFIYNIDKIEKY